MQYLLYNHAMSKHNAPKVKLFTALAGIYSRLRTELYYSSSEIISAFIGGSISGAIVALIFHHLGK